MDFLISGSESGLGKYLFENLPNSVGLTRRNFDSIKNTFFDTIIHCAFNKENKISDYKKYLEDNIFLTSKLKSLNYNKFIYISSVDVYQTNPTIYAEFKKFSESLMGENDLILRCSMLVGDTMKSNHLTKIKSCDESITLSEESEFNYILMSDLKDFFLNKNHLSLNGVYDFVANNSINIKDVVEFFNSTTKLGKFTYFVEPNYINPIYKKINKYNKTSLKNLQIYYGK